MPMMYGNRSTFRKFAAVLLSIFGAGYIHGVCLGASLPAGTAIPVFFTKTVQAGKAKPGDAVTAKTMQIVRLPDGEILPKGTVLVGHVVASQPFTFDATPYAKQQPSRLSIHFDRIAGRNLNLPVVVSVRALANAVTAYDATVPQGIDESDHLGTMVQIGGDHFSPIAKEVLSSDEDIVGYNRKQGVFARLISNEYVSRYASFHCDGADTEQSVAIFSASACGLYGFDTVYMPENGNLNGGTFELDSRRHSVKLYARSAALLEVPGTPQ